MRARSKLDDLEAECASSPGEGAEIQIQKTPTGNAKRKMEEAGMTDVARVAKTLKKEPGPPTRN